MTLDSPLTLNVAAAAAALISRPIVGTGDLIKEGAGPLLLDKINTYSGQTIIRDGTLEMNDAIQPDSPVVLDGGTLQGIGTVGTISATATGGTISVGTDRGDRLFSGSVTMNPTTTFAVEVNGNQHDQLNVSGTVTLGNAILSVIGLPADGYRSSSSTTT